MFVFACGFACPAYDIQFSPFWIIIIGELTFNSLSWFRKLDYFSNGVLFSWSISHSLMLFNMITWSPCFFIVLVRNWYVWSFFRPTWLSDGFNYWFTFRGTLIFSGWSTTWQECILTYMFNKNLFMLPTDDSSWTKLSITKISLIKDITIFVWLCYTSSNLMMKCRS